MRQYSLSICIGLLFSYSAHGFDAADIQKVLANSKAPGVEGFLESLKQTQPQLAQELSTHFTLMKATSSVQDATCQEPRAITYNKDGSVIMSFNAGPNAYHGNGEGTENLEFMLFDKKEKKFKLVDVDFSESPPKVSQNPKNCLACHGDRTGNVVPIWNQFPDWHDAYGAFIDQLSPEEKASLDTFKKKASSDPRYKFLNFESEHPNFPYDLPFNNPDPNGNTGLTQKLNERYAEFVIGEIQKNYSGGEGAGSPEQGRKIQQALFFEDKCKQMIQGSEKGPKGSGDAKEESIDDAESARRNAETARSLEQMEKLKSLAPKIDSLSDELIKNMHPPLNEEERIQFLDPRVSKRKKLFRALTGMGFKGRGLASMRRASEETPKGDACYTDIKPHLNLQQGAGGPAGSMGAAGGVGEVDAIDDSVNPLVLTRLELQIIPQPEIENAVTLGDCLKVANDLLGYTAIKPEPSQQGHNSGAQ